MKHTVDTPTPAEKRTPWADRAPWASWVLWPLAILTSLHKIWASYEPNTTDDFTTVWRAINRFFDGVPVYTEDYSTTDPHFLYLPGGTMLLSPLAWLDDLDAARTVYIISNAIAVIAALAILTHMICLARGWSQRWATSLTSPLWPLSVLATFNTEAVQNNLLFSNINGVLLLLMVLFMYFLLQEGTRTAAFSGIFLGLAITVKPQFVVLLFLPLVRKQWVSLASAILVPVSFNILAWELMAKPETFVDNLLPHLNEVRDFANSSILGVGIYFGLSDPQIWMWRILTALLVLFASLALLRLRNSSYSDQLQWVFSTSAVLLLGVFLVSSLGQMYYSVLLLPLIFGVLLPGSTIRNPIAWIGIYLCLSIDSWYSEEWIWSGRYIEYLRGTIGWLLIVVSIAVTAVVHFFLARNNGVNLHRSTGGKHRHE